ncbi:MAG: 1-deoxy-D-xylulose-5-phosphate synthase [Propionibacteriaceae bacterium]|jgi:1-deoxy-D-xylulose-5-phosphate synthase|nr:1-deoxy-D-xylulose-5-phosphate synthase [Propionibacteriaceae bacterium]
MTSLGDVTCPHDLRDLSAADLTELAQQIRAFLIEKVSATGGHLGPNLGVVELTMAIHRVFDSPQDPVVFDTGHISYVHKILTGRQRDFATLRQADGLSGYPSRAESEHDWMENSHASTALSWGAGLAEAFRITGDRHTVVVVVGDGALTGGMAWEALNNIAVHKDLHMVVVVNDNGRSYTSTVGGLAQHLTRFRTDRRYDQTLDVVKAVVQKTPLVGMPAYELLHGLKVGLKDILAPQELFSDLGLKYIGPVDGHDRVAVEKALIQAKSYARPVIVHCMTEKGRGFSAAESCEADKFHAIGAIDPVTGEPLNGESGPTWTRIFATEMVALGREDKKLVGVSAAMVDPVGLGPFEAAFPSRVFDVGIAEQHAVVSAAGMAMAGLHPVVAVYATFLNRGIDQILMDVGLHQMPVTFVLDRAGITGPDGSSHHGIWDLALLTDVPGMRIAAPRDGSTLRRVLREAVGDAEHPTTVRFPKGEVAPATVAIRSVDGVDVLVDEDSPQVAIIGYGPLAALAMEVAEDLRALGVRTLVVDPVWVWPLSLSLLGLVRNCAVVVSIEDGVDVGGLGEHLGARLSDEGSAARVVRVAVPTMYIPQGSRETILADLGFSREAIVPRVQAAMV